MCTRTTSLHSKKAFCNNTVLISTVALNLLWRLFNKWNEEKLILMDLFLALTRSLVHTSGSCLWNETGFGFLFWVLPKTDENTSRNCLLLLLLLLLLLFSYYYNVCVCVGGDQNQQMDFSKVLLLHAATTAAILSTCKARRDNGLYLVRMEHCVWSKAGATIERTVYCWGAGNEVTRTSSNE